MTTLLYLLLSDIFYGYIVEPLYLLMCVLEFLQIYIFFLDEHTICTKRVAT